jgi:hypothetical protein
MNSQGLLNSNLDIQVILTKSRASERPQHEASE